jgi:hypothetical protein
VVDRLLLCEPVKNSVGVPEAEQNTKIWYLKLGVQMSTRAKKLSWCMFGGFAILNLIQVPPHYRLLAAAGTLSGYEWCLSALLNASFLWE